MNTADDLTAMALRNALRRTTARYPFMSPILDRNDLRQAGALALLQSHRDPSRSVGEQRSYMIERAAGAMIDEMRRASPLSRSDDRPEIVSCEDLQPEERSIDPPQDGELAVMGACRAMLAEKHPIPLIFAAVLAGAERQQIAAHLGVSPSRIGDYMRRIRAVLHHHFDTLPAHAHEN